MLTQGRCCREGASAEARLPSSVTETFDILAACAFGLEAVVVRELADLGYDAKAIATGRVHFRGDALGVARANLWLRSADRVLIRVAAWPAKDFDALFDGTRSLPWERWIGVRDAFPVNGRSVKSQLSSVPAVQRTVKKAIVERLMSAHGTNVLDETGAEVSVEIALLNDEATLTIDTSGVGLHKRGYRNMVGEAALKETLAAGLVLLSAWRPFRPLIDPFCGTGTIAIEAAMIGHGIAPGLGRPFAAERWRSFPVEAWRAARDEGRSRDRRELAYTIHASDIDEDALRLARLHAAAAGVDRSIHFSKRAFEDLSSKAEYGCIITNPPYGVRMGDADEIERLYRSMPMVLRKLPTWSFHILTARTDMERMFGQPATRRRKLYNAQVECTYFTFLGPKPPKAGEGRGVSGAARGESAESGAELSEGSAAEPGDAAPATAQKRAPVGPAFGGLRERDTREAEEFAARLTKNLHHLRRYPSRGIHCYRVYERDCPDVPLIVDRYGDDYHAVEYEREHSRTGAQQADWVDLMRSTIAKVAGVDAARVFMKEKHRQKGLTQHERTGAGQSAIRTVEEGGLRFEINLSDYIDTGLFLDHRLTRGMVREWSAGKRLLNLFCYTGSFSVYAAAGGAASTTSVDLSNTYLDWAARNFELNGMRAVPLGDRSGTNQLNRADCMEFLREHRRGPHYDLAVVDPPTFSNSKSTEEDWEVAEGHAALLELLTPLMAPGGTIVFSTNYRRFKLDEDVVARLGMKAVEISKRTVPPEYRNTRIHRCWRMTVGG